MEEINFQLRRSRNFLIFHIVFPLLRTTLDPFPDPSLDYPRRRTHITHHFDPPLGRFPFTVSCVWWGSNFPRQNCCTWYMKFNFIDRSKLCIYLRSCKVATGVRPRISFDCLPFCVCKHSHSKTPHAISSLTSSFARITHYFYEIFRIIKRGYFFFIIPCNFPAPSEQKKLRMGAKGESCNPR